LDLVPTRCPDHLGTEALRSRYKLYQLGPEKLEDIVHSIKVDYLTYKSAADLHNIKFSLVSSIMTNLKKDPEYITKRKEKLQIKEHHAQLVVAKVQDKLQRHEHLTSRKSLTEELNGQHDLELNYQQVGKIMKDVIGLKYKKFQKGEIQANSQRCLVQRQQYAIIMLRLLASGKRVYNVDESWLDQMNFTRSHWQPMRLAKEGIKPVSPRISVIACVGTDGSAYYSLTQVNTDENVFCLYLTELTKRLDGND
jgi:hypothetical protein